jgi:hypothetical protein
LYNDRINQQQRENKMSTDLKTLEAVRNIRIIHAAPEENLDFELGYLEGQNEMLDRVVSMLEDQIREEATAVFADVCHQSAITAFLVNRVPAVPMLETEMEGWKLS